MFNEFTQYIDLTQVVLYLFWIFFFGLVFWLRREDRREGYPLEMDAPYRVGNPNSILIPKPKLFWRPDGSTYAAPDFARDEREIPLERLANAKGSPSEPIGDPLGANVGPGAYAARHDEPELTYDGHLLIVPLRVATDFTIMDPHRSDARGWTVVGADGESPGVVRDIWVDRADMLVRYLEITLEDGTHRLAPIQVSLLDKDEQLVEISALKGAQFARVPTLKAEDAVTLYEEERIGAFYAGGRLYADPSRVGPKV